MDLKQLAQAAKQTPPNRSILIYGDAKSGKTRLAGTIAKIPSIRKVYWFDLENGRETLINMVREGVLTPEQAEKIKIYSIQDSSESPLAMETMLKGFTSKVPVTICEEHGKIACPACKQSAKPFQNFFLKELTAEDFVVIDSGSQLGSSIMAYLTKDKPLGFKPGWDEYGPQGLMLDDFFSVVQVAKTNICMLTQTIYAEGEDGREKLYPLVGTRNYSSKVAKYFGHVVLLNISNKEHKGGSSTLYKIDALTGSRSGWRIEDLKSLDFSLLYEKLQEDSAK